MKIYDPTSKSVLKNVTLFLSPAEALELADAAADLAKNPIKNHHHIGELGEIIVAVHTPQTIEQFDAEARGVIDAK